MNIPASHTESVETLRTRFSCSRNVPVLFLALSLFLFLPKSSVAQDRMHFGVNVDLLPTVMSATEGRFGGAGQVWVAVGKNRFRAVAASMRLPDSFSEEPWSDNDLNAFALIYDRFLREPVRGPWVGTGVEFWNQSITYHERTKFFLNNWIATLGAGWVFRIGDHFLLDPWVGLHWNVIRSGVGVWNRRVADEATEVRRLGP